MGFSNGKITVPIDPSDVSLAIGENSYDYGTLCMSKKVIKWNVHKPMRGFSIEDLLEAQFVGQSADVSEGIIYGLKAATPMGTLAGIHDCDFSYLGQPGSAGPHRIDDFIGYRTDAGPLPTAEVEEWKNIAYDKYIIVDFSYAKGGGGTGVLSSNNAGMVSVDAIIKATEGSSTGTGLSAYYPCACVRINGQDYIRALDSGTGNAFVPRTMAQNGSWMARAYVNLNEGALSGITFADGQEIKVSIFFMKPTSISAYSAWTAVQSNQLVNFRAFGCPEAVGKIVTLKSFRPGLKCTQPIRVGNIFRMSVLEADSWSAATYHVYASISKVQTSTENPVDALQSTATVTFNSEGTSTGNLLPKATLEFNTGSLSGPSGGPSGNYNYNWKVYVLVNGKEIVTNSGSGVVTF